MAIPARVVLVEPASDDGGGHARSIARAMRDAGMEVVYLGVVRSPEQIARVAVQEDAHAVGVAADLLETVRAALAHDHADGPHRRDIDHAEHDHPKIDHPDEIDQPDEIDHPDEVVVFEIDARTEADAAALVDQLRATAHEA